MIKVENKYDFTVEELTDILEQTPIAVDMSTNAAVAEYIIQALNINRIIKFASDKMRKTSPKEISMDSKIPLDPENPYRVQIVRNDGSKVFESNARFIALYSYCSASDQTKKVMVSEKSPRLKDLANVCELLGNTTNWDICR